MATLGQLGEVVTEQLRRRVERLASAVESESPDFSEIANGADSVAEFADAIADLYTEIERRLLGGLEGGDADDAGRRPRAQRRQSQRRQQEQPPAQHEPARDDVTKDELLEQARELHVDGRSSMTKEQLAQAIEAEESVTKDELLDRARDAQIEGRSSMTKEELREALNEAGA
jgi:hypothetical protein